MLTKNIFFSKVPSDKNIFLELSVTVKMILYIFGSSYIVLS